MAAAAAEARVQYSAMVLGAVMLGEPVTPVLLGGLAAVIGGIVLTIWR